MPAAPPAGAEDILTEAGAPTIPPSAPTPEPIDPAPVVEDVHHNLEPDVAAGWCIDASCCQLLHVKYS